MKEKDVREQYDKLVRHIFSESLNNQSITGVFEYHPEREDSYPPLTSSMTQSQWEHFERDTR